MTEISFYLDEKEEYFGFEAKGHAGFKRSGKDIVCAGISALTITFINSIDELLKKEIVVETDEKTGYMLVKVPEYSTPEVQLLFSVLHLGLKEIEKEYTRYLKLTNRRCKP